MIPNEMIDTPKVYALEEKWRYATEARGNLQTALDDMFCEYAQLERELAVARICLREAIGYRDTRLSGYDLEEWRRAAGSEEITATPPATITGRVIEVGNLECLDNAPGLIILTTKEQLRAHSGNLAFCDVEIRVRPNATDHQQPEETR